jgi:hypothetical protein
MANTLVWWNVHDAQYPSTNPAVPDLLTGTTGRAELPTLKFVGSADKYAEFAGVMPEFYDGTSSVTITVIFTTANTDTVKWEFTFSAQGDGDAKDATWGSLLDGATATGPEAANDFEYATLASVTNANMDGVQPGESFRMELFRDVSDGTSSVDAHVIAVTIEV